MTGTRVLLLAALALSVVTSAGAFSAVDADRQVGVTVVADADAYLGITEVQTAAMETDSGTAEFPIPDGDLPKCAEVREGLCVQGQWVRLVPEDEGIGQEKLWKVDSEEALDDETLHAQNSVVVSGATTTVFRVQNHFSQPVTVTADVADSPAGLTVSDVHTTGSGAIDPGDSTDVRATFECDDDVFDAAVSFDVAAAGDGVSAERDGKTVRVTCIAA